MTKRIKSKVKVVTKKAKLLVKKANVKIGKTAKSLQKEWKADKPKRDKLKKELTMAVSGMVRNGARIGTDVIEVIKRDIREINNK